MDRHRISSMIVSGMGCVSCAAAGVTTTAAAQADEGDDTRRIMVRSPYVVIGTAYNS
jgi:hypothetical protein